MTSTIVIGEVLMFHVHEEVAGQTPSGSTIVDYEKFKPIARLGGNTYARVASTFDLPRPDRCVHCIVVRQLVVRGAEASVIIVAPHLPYCTSAPCYWCDAARSSSIVAHAVG